MESCLIVIMITVFYKLLLSLASLILLCDFTFHIHILASF